MEYLQLNNEVKMSMLGFGTFMINGEECEKVSYQQLNMVTD